MVSVTQLLLHVFVVLLQMIRLNMETSVLVLVCSDLVI